MDETNNDSMDEIIVTKLPPKPKNLFREFEESLSHQSHGHGLNGTISEVYWTPFNKKNPLAMSYQNDEYSPGIVVLCRGQLFRINIFNFTKKTFYQLGDERSDDTLIVVGCGKYTHWGKLSDANILKTTLDIFNSHHLKPKPSLVLK